MPKHLEGLRDVITFIPAENTNGIVEIEDIARGKFIIEKPHFFTRILNQNPIRQNTTRVTKVVAELPS